MSILKNNRFTPLALAALWAVALAAGCSPAGRTQPEPPSSSSHDNVTTLRVKDHPMTVSPSIASQRQAQETFYHYIQATLRQLPFAVTLDNHRYSAAASVIQCDDRIDQRNAPIQYYDLLDTHLPPGTDYNDFVVKVGDIWKSWGWKVEERDSDDTPNRTGTSPDGYELHTAVYSGQLADFPPKFDGHSPCFPASLRDDDVPKPRVITKDKLLYDEPGATPTR